MFYAHNALCPMNKILRFAGGMLFLLFMISGFAFSQPVMEWAVEGELPPNPPSADRMFGEQHPGLAGTYAGVLDGILIVAGGANFPESPPWEGGEKENWDHIYVQDLSGNEGMKVAGQRLPVPMGYGVSVTDGNRLILAGGENKDGIVTGVWELTWDREKEMIYIDSLPPLPENVKAIAGVKMGNAVYIHGIRKGENVLLRRDTDGSWMFLTGCPGPARDLPAAAVQNDGYGERFYLFCGRTTGADGKIELLNDGWSYDPSVDEWKETGIGGGEDDPGCVMGASAVKSGSSHILVWGGDDGEALLRRLEWIEKIDLADSDSLRLTLEKELRGQLLAHPGFSNQIWAYHTLTETWNLLDTFPVGIPVTTSVVTWDGSYWIISGESNPGVRSPLIWRGRMIDTMTPFGWLNYLVIVVYFIAMLLIGVKYSRRQKSTEDYFKGGGRIPWWAAGLSLFGTSLSAITFMAIPAKTYMTDWGYFFFQMTPLLAAPVLIALYIPYFRSLNITSAYEYLENRFNLLTRILGSLSFIILQLGRVGIILFLPSIAIHLVTGIGIELCIVSMGVVSIVYTMMGGIEAVVWTDVLQVVILMGGAFLCLILIFSQIGESPAKSYEVLTDHRKFQILDTAMDWSRPMIWVVILGGFFSNLITSGSDQTMVQRYLTTATEGEARRSVWTFALLAIPATLIFFTIGTSLYLYYMKYPEDLNPVIENEDAIFPWYIVTQLPAGMSGLLVAGIFSAAMSSLSSSMNSVSTAFITDFYRRFSWGNARSELMMARVSTLTFGLIGVLFAVMMASREIQSLWDQFQLYVGLFAGGLGGLFLLGMTVSRANGRGAVAGLFLSGVIQYGLMMYTQMHVLLFAATGFLSCFILSWGMSLIFPDRD